MECRITVVQALDERDLLIKKIRKRTENAQFVDLIRGKAPVTWGRRVSQAEFAAAVQSEFTQLRDLIARYDALNAAITAANAATWLDTSRGRMTVACAIALRNRLRGNGPYGDLTDFEGRLVRQMRKNWREAQNLMRRKNGTMRRENARKKETCSGGRIIMLQNPENSEADRADRESTAAEQTTAGRLQLVDPLQICARAEEMEEQREALLAELDTKLKISNATTYVTV